MVAASGQVTYFTLQLETEFEFEFGMPVTAASFRDELWALMSGGDLFLCQDQFYVRQRDT
jgi:hypothetical protein